jgi:hypothetical protein
VNDERDAFEAITHKRVCKRLSIVIEALPRSLKQIHDELLKNIRIDLVAIRAAVAYLEQQQKGQK